MPATGPGESVLSSASATRRGFIAAGATAAAALLAGCGGNEEERPAPSGEPRAEARALQLALELEDVQEAFYRAALERDVVEDKAIHDLLAQVHEQERSHARALRAALRQVGEHPPSPPEVATGRLLAKSEDEALSAALELEQLATSAYLTALGIVRSEDLLAALLSIHSVEARQAAGVATAAGAEPLAGRAIPEPPPLTEVRRRLDRYLAGPA